MRFDDNQRLSVNASSKRFRASSRRPVDKLERLADATDCAKPVASVSARQAAYIAVAPRIGKFRMIVLARRSCLLLPPRLYLDEGVHAIVSN